VILTDADELREALAIAVKERDEARAERDHLEVLCKAEMEHANKWAARARKAESDYLYMNRIRDHLAAWRAACRVKRLSAKLKVDGGTT
jgi:hypothetical protein